ncbi:sensor histidine kinase [Pontibacter harenae]|uniref:sensor histidine kinase n=1 Tax=Pontibacter harenae TaxID=2894083 RepID=UPI001E36FC16|nr:histidine kinase [Pontibacter harenae]MCC9168006.1 histidine kinase [Pontibacter harenae]
MNDIKKKFTVFHLSGWLLTFLFFCWVFWSEGHPNWLYLSSTIILAGIAVFYSHFLLLTRYLNRKRYGLYLLGLTVVLLAGPLPFLLAEGGSNDLSTFLDQYFTKLFSMVLLCVVLSWGARATENWFTDTLKRESSQKQAAQAELAYLKSQINPHFLFNTLNNIHTLVYKQSESAPDAVRCLSSLMRYMIYESTANTVPLEREINYLQDYISLQQLRYKNAPVVNIDIAGEINSCEIAPLVLINLLENTYKHSPARLNIGDIKVKIAIGDNSLTFMTHNPIRSTGSKPLDEPGGIGLDNVKKRLQLLYPGQHTLKVTSKEEFFTVELTIPCHHLQNHERETNMLYN